MKTLYLHGFNSFFDKKNSKVKQLSKISSEVLGLDIDYWRYPSDTIERVHTFVCENSIDLIVGTSMGGWLAATVGGVLGVPWVAINPAISPRISLQRHIGHNVDYRGREYTLERDVVNAYSDMTFHGCGLVLLDCGDELFDSRETRAAIGDRCRVVCFDGGSHRFDHMKEALPLIQDHYHNCIVCYEL